MLGYLRRKCATGSRSLFQQQTQLGNGIQQKLGYVVRPWAEGMILLAMPKLSHNMTHGSVKKWLKSEGDLVKEQELLLEIETDSLTHNAEKVGRFEGNLVMEIESAEEAYLAKILVNNSDKELKVGTPIAVLCDSATMVKKAAEFDPPVINVYDDELQIRTFSWQAFLKADDKRGMDKVRKVLDEYKK
eukprot:TRINITY_DN679_c0_g1_i1.p1 TRINITY_DN679_c0_g1~~TRINITY_DN679_c0_g1_i1.p1  ORF type:complete len:188 (+),score=22.97 TRINITY_DN679_c0_g1_i1:141-704(+)